MPTKQTWETVRDKALKTVAKCLDSSDQVDLPRAKIATSLLSSFTRHEATESAKQQTAVIVARQLATDKNQFREYLNISSAGFHIPQLPVGPPES